MKTEDVLVEDQFGYRRVREREREREREGGREGS
jgi:hypothetical protein